ncbi:hypothetical protein MMC30_003634 [Trapelia coarctata]|nr:hypothetical protein [Trapelia coarctata]
MPLDTPAVGGDASGLQHTGSYVRTRDKKQGSSGTSGLGPRSYGGVAASHNMGGTDFRDFQYIGSHARPNKSGHGSHKTRKMRASHPQGRAAAQGNRHSTGRTDHQQGPGNNELTHANVERIPDARSRGGYYGMDETCGARKSNPGLRFGDPVSKSRAAGGRYGATEHMSGPHYGSGREIGYDIRPSSRVEEKALFPSPQPLPLETPVRAMDMQEQSPLGRAQHSRREGSYSAGYADFEDRLKMLSDKIHGKEKVPGRRAERLVLLSSGKDIIRGQEPDIKNHLSIMPYTAISIAAATLLSTDVDSMEQLVKWLNKNLPLLGGGNIRSFNENICRDILKVTKQEQPDFYVWATGFVREEKGVTNMMEFLADGGLNEKTRLPGYNPNQEMSYDALMSAANALIRAAGGDTNPIPRNESFVRRDPQGPAGMGAYGADAYGYDGGHVWDPEMDTPAGCTAMVGMAVTEVDMEGDMDEIEVDINGNCGPRDMCFYR